MDPVTAWGEYAKLGIGFASFGALIWFLKWLANELKDSRVHFLVALDKQHADHASEMHLLREHNERQVVRLYEAIEGLGDDIKQHNNGRDKKG